jgi:hypothetical protein
MGKVSEGVVFGNDDWLLNRLNSSIFAESSCALPGPVLNILARLPVFTGLGLLRKNRLVRFGL